MFDENQIVRVGVSLSLSPLSAVAKLREANQKKKKKVGGAHGQRGEKTGNAVPIIILPCCPFCAL
jgi:hypothetical protein